MACARVLGSCGGLGQAPPVADSVLQVYDRLEGVETPPELLVALVEATGELVAASRDAAQLKHLLARLYTPRFALSFSTAKLRVVFSQIKVSPQVSREGSQGTHRDEGLLPCRSTRTGSTTSMRRTRCYLRTCKRPWAA